MSDIQISRSADALTAACFVDQSRQDRYPGLETLRDLISRAGIVSGLDLKSVTQMVAQKICAQRVVIARGRPPQSGVDGRIEYAVNVLHAGKPRQNADGSVDHYDLQTVINVRKNDVLARRIPPVPGRDGESVSGTVIVAKPPHDALLKAGRGTVIADDNPNVLIATIDGAVSLSGDKVLEVSAFKEIKGDIDYATGNISFVGDLLISGTVRAGFKVDTEGACEISGRVEDATVHCRGELKVRGGAVGDKSGLLHSSASVAVRHAENFTVQAGKDISIAEDAILCRLDADGSIHAKSIVGGTMSAGIEMVVDALGAQSGTKTVVDIGRLQALLARIAERSNVLAQKRAEIESIKETMFCLVRDEMDTQGMLVPQATIRLGAFRIQKESAAMAEIALQKEIAAIQEQTAVQSNPTVRAKLIFPGTVIKLGTVEKEIDTEIRHAVIFGEDNKILVTNGQ